MNESSDKYKDIIHRMINNSMKLSEEVYRYDKNSSFLYSSRITDIMQAAEILLEGGYITSEHFEDINDHFRFLKARYEDN